MIGETPTRIPAVAAAPGIARARWAELRRTALPAPRQIAATETAAEIDRLNAAANEAAMELMALSDRVAEEGHEAESAIFAAHAAIAWDPALMAAATEEIEGQRTDAIGGSVPAGRGTGAPPPGGARPPVHAPPGGHLPRPRPDRPPPAGVAAPGGGP